VAQAIETSRLQAWSRLPLTQSSVRLRNAWLVLGNIRRAGTTTRTQIADETGLTGTTVHRITGDLRRRRLVLNVGGPDKNVVGRPPELFRFNAGIGHVIAIDVGNETMRAGIADLDGTLLARRRQPTTTIEGDLVRAIEESIAELQREVGARPDKLVGMAVGVAAVAEPEGTIVRASVHHLWEGLELGAQLRRRFDCEVVVAQDDHLATLAELEMGGCVGLRDALVVNLGKGIGAGIIADGTIYRGAHSAAGRLGWISLDIGGDGRAGVLPVGQVLTADGLIGEYRRLGGSRQVAGAIDVFAADEDGDLAARDAIDTFADRLGWLIASAVALIDPQRVVIGGGISGSFDRLADRMKARLREVVAVPPPVVRSELGPEAVVSGAVAAAIRLADEWLVSRLGG